VPQDMGNNPKKFPLNTFQDLADTHFLQSRLSVEGRESYSRLQNRLHPKYTLEILHRTPLTNLLAAPYQIQSSARNS
jgi:hypothetical protein